jgi:hypothetical protein
MSAISLLISVVLAAQVASGGDRYSDGSTTTDAGALESLEDSDANAQGSPGSAADETAAASDPGGLVPMVEPFSPRSDAAAPSTQTAPPPFSNTQSPFGTNRSGAPRGFASPPVSSQAPAAAPPPIGAYPSQGSARVESSPPEIAGKGLKPSAMMRAMLMPPAVTRLAGQPIALAVAVSGAPTREQQSERIEAYWDLCSSVADYYLSLREQDELRRLRSLLPSAAPTATWQQAESELGVRVSTSQVAAVASQHRLASLMNIAGDRISLPLPADVPHCGDYQTRYEHNFAGRANLEAQELVALLPLRYEELKDAAAAVTRAEQWLTAERVTADETAMLRALELLALRRRAFVQIARDYNRRIARYSELATPGEIDSGRLIGMLIKSTLPATATRSSSDAPPPDRQTNRDATSPRTYAEGWIPVNDAWRRDATRDEAVEPASAETHPPYKERSLLVKPPR